MKLKLKLTVWGTDLGQVLAGSVYLLMATMKPWYSPRYTSEVDVVMKGSLGCSYFSSSGLIILMTSSVALGLFTVKTHTRWRDALAR